MDKFGQMESVTESMCHPDAVEVSGIQNSQINAHVQYIMPLKIIINRPFHNEVDNDSKLKYNLLH